MITTLLPFERLSEKTIQEKDSLRVMVFSVMDYFFAFPIGAILRIIPCPPFTTEDNGIGMIDLGSQTVTIVDLRHKFIKKVKDNPVEAISTANNSPNFLIMFQTQVGELCGIPVEKAPILTDLALKNIRPVPLSYRQISELSFVNHMAVIPQEEQESLKIFCLGTNEILAEKLGWNQNNNSQEETRELKLINQRKRFLRVSITQEFNGLFPLESVQQVIHLSLSEISPTPANPAWMLGLYNWKGQSIRIADLNQLLGFKPLLQSDFRRDNLMAIVLKLQNQIAGIAVSDVYKLEWQDLENLKEMNTDSSELNKFIKGTFPDSRWLFDPKALGETLKGQTH
ncbi:MAG: chemotaxis protein CheW [Xenococcaceae cyanobacterium]